MTLHVGLTGGIASGKSTVSRLFSDAGLAVIDYDLIARDVVSPGSAGLAQVSVEFGPEFIDAAGNMDRALMGALVFSDTESLRKLEAITHPLIRCEATRQASEASGIVIHDNPLLVEMGAHRSCEVVVVVDVLPEVQIERMVRDRAMSVDEAQQRMAHQMSRSERLAVADVVIDNSGSRQDLEGRVSEVIDQLRARATLAGPSVAGT